MGWRRSKVGRGIRGERGRNREEGGREGRGRSEIARMVGGEGRKGVDGKGASG